MMKKIIALTLCLLMLVPVFAACSDVDDVHKGAYITMYITEPVYNFDPARAYGNEAALKIVSLMFDNLFILSENGKVQKSLAKSYDIIEDEETNEYKMVIKLKQSAWSNGNALQAQDVVNSWRRILDCSNSFDAAVLLYDIKNAKEAKEGSVSIDDVGISAPNNETVEIIFTGKIDYDQFILKLTSYALAPILENVVDRPQNEFDWAKNPTVFAASGPFKLREISYEKGAEQLILERNSYYLRNVEKDKLDKTVKPYRLVVDFSKSAEEIMQDYKDGNIFYVGNIPLSMRGEWKDEVEKSDALSTHSFMINQNAEIKYKNPVGDKTGEKIFADANVRKALSVALNREAIAEAVVFAKPATGLVPEGVFNAGNKRKTFREEGENLIASSANRDEAIRLLGLANVDPKQFTFSISVPAYDDVHMAIAALAQAAWNDLGFDVKINAIDVKENTDIDTETGEAIGGVRDDVFAEMYARGEYEIASIDYTALSVDPFSVLAPFAYGFTGGAAIDNKKDTGGLIPEFKVPTHISGYNSTAYNEKITAAFNETDTKERAGILHEAEAILMDEMPIIPVVFNQNATLTSKKLTGEKVTYYGTPIFTKLKLKNYKDYLPEDEKAKLESKKK